jgi:hypothetical protein
MKATFINLLKRHADVTYYSLALNTTKNKPSYKNDRSDNFNINYLITKSVKIAMHIGVEGEKNIVLYQ